MKKTHPRRPWKNSFTHLFSFSAFLLLIFSCSKDKEVESQNSLKGDFKSSIIEEKSFLSSGNSVTLDGCIATYRAELNSGDLDAGENYNECVDNLDPSLNTGGTSSDPILATNPDPLYTAYWIRSFDDLMVLAGINNSESVAEQITDFTNYYANAIDVVKNMYSSVKSDEQNFTDMLYYMRGMGYALNFYQVGGGELHPSPLWYFIKSAIYSKKFTEGDYPPQAWIDNGFLNTLDLELVTLEPPILP